MPISRRWCAGACERLHAAGVPIARVQLSFSMLHPLYRGIGYTWRRGQGLQVDAYRHTPGDAKPDRWLKSPFYHLKRHNLDHLRRRLDTGGASEFPIFDDLRQEGLTDYLAFTSSFEMGKGQGMIGSWSTDQRGGFSDGEIEALLGIQDTLAVACKMATRDGRGEERARDLSRRPGRRARAVRARSSAATARPRAPPSSGATCGIQLRWPSSGARTISTTSTPSSTPPPGPWPTPAARS